ncbi:lecithin retinol acyltransferase family protein [Nocardioides sp. CN2-186]|uniref:lecithin retinol acyltransferase family protein n=1 Tax=Nocardioides tweenelious TaxID=3156607 RepID=UPI0032B3875A
MNRGDHIYVRRRARYSHHGIYCGDGTVIHYVGGRGTLRRVERTPLESFASGGEIQVRAYRTRLPVEEIIRNAESRLGTHGYHLVRNNCEHLATWSATGAPRSSQVRRWAMAAPGAAASYGVADAAGAHLMLLGSVGMMGLYTLTSPLRRSRRRGRTAASFEASPAAGA